MIKIGRFDFRLYWRLSILNTESLTTSTFAWAGSFENEALENKDLSTKHLNLENEAPKSRNRSTQNSKTEHPNLVNEAPKLETCLSFKNTRQSLVKSPAAGIKHDNK